VRLGQGARLGAGGVAAGGQAEQRTHLLEREAELSRTPDEPQATHILLAVTAIAAAPGRRRHQPGAFVVADRLDGAAAAARHRADPQTASHRGLLDRA
jgi:hypothetical protein